jgi:hypothetical protein
VKSRVTVIAGADVSGLIAARSAKASTRGLPQVLGSPRQVGIFRGPSGDWIVGCHGQHVVNEHVLSFACLIDLLAVVGHQRLGSRSYRLIWSIRP